MEKLQKKVSPFRLSSLLRLESDPKLALRLFRNPTRNPIPNSKPEPFRYSIFSYDLIINKLGRAKMFSEMEQIVEQMKHETRFTANEPIFCNIISFYGRARDHNRALATYQQIPSFRCQRTVKSFNTLLHALLDCKQFDKMNELVADIYAYAQPDVCTCNTLINAAIVCDDLDTAWYVFDEMPKKEILPNVVTFGTLISGLCDKMMLEKAFALKENMVQTFNLRPNASIYVALMKGLCKVNQLDSAFNLKKEMLDNEVELNAAIYATLISVLYESGRKGEVSELLDEMKLHGCKPDVATYNALISGSCNERDFGSAFRLLQEMAGNGCKPNVVSYNTIIAAYCKQGKLKKANCLFQDMPRRECKPDVLTYRIMFDGFCDGMKLKEAALILDEMVFKGYVPRDASICSFTDKLVEKGDMKLLGSVLNTLAKGNYIDVGTWGKVISRLCKRDKLFNTCNSIDTISNSNQFQ